MFWTCRECQNCEYRYFILLKSLKYAVYEIRILGTFRKIASIINSFSIQRKVVASYSFVQNISFGILTEHRPSWKPIFHYLVKKPALVTKLSDYIIQYYSLFDLFPNHIMPAGIAKFFFSPNLFYCRSPNYY